MHRLYIFLILALTLVSTTVYGKENAMASSLSVKQQKIVMAAACAARGDQSGLKTALAEGLDNGVTINEYKEVLVQLTLIKSENNAPKNTNMNK